MQHLCNLRVSRLAKACFLGLQVESPLGPLLEQLCPTIHYPSRSLGQHVKKALFEHIRRKHAADQRDALRSGILPQILREKHTHPATLQSTYLPGHSGPQETQCRLTQTSSNQRLGNLPEPCLRGAPQPHIREQRRRGDKLGARRGITQRVQQATLVIHPGQRSNLIHEHALKPGRPRTSGRDFCTQKRTQNLASEQFPAQRPGAHMENLLLRKNTAEIQGKPPESSKTARNPMETLTKALEEPTKTIQ